MTPQELAKQMNKMLGANVISLGNDQRYKVTYTSTGLLPVDVLLGGGLPRGRFTVFTGAYSTLKSYIGLHAIAEIQKKKGVAALIDTEHAYDPDWADEIGVDTSKLIVWPPLESDIEATGEEAVDAAELMIRAKVDLIVFDSVAATLPQDEQKKRLSRESIQPGRQAALMSAACRRLTAPNQRTGVLWINQLREQIGVTFGNPEKAPGGRALGYYASQIVNIRTAGKQTKDTKTFTGDKEVTSKVQIGQTFKAVLEKSKLSAPWREVYFDFSLVTGSIDLVKFIFAQAVDLGLITKRGNTWSTENLSVVGREKFLAKLAEDKAALKKLELKIREHYGLHHGKPRTVKAGVDKSNGRSSSSNRQGRTLARDQDVSVSTGRRLKR